MSQRHPLVPVPSHTFDPKDESSRKQEDDELPEVTKSKFVSVFSQKKFKNCCQKVLHFFSKAVFVLKPVFPTD